MQEELKQQIIRKCTHLDVPLVGFASALSWNRPPFQPWVPEAFRPSAIYPEVKTVIVIGLPVDLPIVETAPSIWYHELYRTVNSLLDIIGYRIALSLTMQGYPSVWVPRDGYGSISTLKKNPVVFFSHRHAAYLAGLGTFGVNNQILTRKFGPRVRFASVFTAAEIPPDQVMEKQLCTRCMQCVEVCPVTALPGLQYPDGLTDKKACAERAEGLFRRSISPCGLCIRVCPVGEDRKIFHREDTGMYDEQDPRFDIHHRAWQHVRSYGGS